MTHEITNPTEAVCTQSFNVFSFRAECQRDVHALESMLSERTVCTIVPDSMGLPDCDVEIRADITLGALMKLIRTIPDGHIMLQTVRAIPLLQNSLDRDFDVV